MDLSLTQKRFLNEWMEFLKIPSVSADPAYQQDVLNTAEAVKDRLEKAGCDFVEICETPGYPIVYGEKIIDNKTTNADHMISKFSKNENLDELYDK